MLLVGAVVLIILHCNVIEKQANLHSNIADSCEMSSSTMLIIAFAPAMKKIYLYSILTLREK